MKKLILIAALLSLALCASAQQRLFDFSSNNNRYEIGMSGGQFASNTRFARFGLGVNTTIWGAYLDLNKVNAQHKYDNHFSDTKWDDDESFCINAGYQIPILPWLRVMPILGYGQTNQGVTDASTINVDDSSEGSATLYHTYTVTPGTREHYFNYGGGISVQPLKWFSLNFVYTRFGIYGGFGLNITAF